MGTAEEQRGDHGRAGRLACVGVWQRSCFDGALVKLTMSIAHTPIIFYRYSKADVSRGNMLGAVRSTDYR